MSYFIKFLERIFWGIAGLALSLVILFAVLHILKNQNVPVVGAPLAGAASWVGRYASNY